MHDNLRRALAEAGNLDIYWNLSTVLGICPVVCSIKRTKLQTSTNKISSYKVTSYKLLIIMKACTKQHMLISVLNENLDRWSFYPVMIQTEAAVENLSSSAARIRAATWTGRVQREVKHSHPTSFVMFIMYVSLSVLPGVSQAKVKMYLWNLLHLSI